MAERAEDGNGASPGLPTVAYQGVPGSYSFDACGEAEPDRYAIPCTSFEDVFEQVREGRAERALVPIANSSVGRVPDVLRLLPDSGLHIIREHFMPIRHQLLGCRGARLSDVRIAESHPVALGQCRRFLMANNIAALPVLDTAGAAAGIARQGDRSKAAIASESAGVIYNLEAAGPEHPGRRFQHDPLLDHGTRAGEFPGALAAHHDEHIFHGAQYTRRALQGVERLRERGCKHGED